eukprot:TRINITY_DN66434_c11_g1_i1.p1 TRINITY_DN66434_c11_g1~~TRINITY_DN66434_c11_g1_i1.p1  ORF type:complete len:328 (+),score=150.82 TRINITY_DN66434_c11_g1_i1:45-1028(+)
MIVFPGDDVTSLADAAAASDDNNNTNSSSISSKKKKKKQELKTRIGAGVVRNASELMATRCGVLRRDKIGGATRKVWVDATMRRYMPQVDDMVVGTVLERHKESYVLDIGSSHPARLPTLAFEGATKRNKPNIEVGSLVYARVEAANKDMEPELTCISPHIKKDWVTGESMFGELHGGYLFKCSLSLAHKLLDDECWVLQCLGSYMPFELAIGMNGRVWLNAETPLHIVIASNAILNSENMKDSHVQTMVHALTQSAGISSVTERRSTKNSNKKKNGKRRNKRKHSDDGDDDGYDDGDDDNFQEDDEFDNDIADADVADAAPMSDSE